MTAKPPIWEEAMNKKLPLRKFIENRINALNTALQNILKEEDDEQQTAIILARLEELNDILRFCQERGRY